MKLTRNRKSRRNRRHTRKGGAPKTMDNNLSNCVNYWSDYNSNKCLRPWNKSDTNIRPFDIIDYPGIQNKIMGKKPTWLPETSTTGLAQNIRFKDDKKFMEEIKKSKIQMTPYTEVPKGYY
jgi:hypothetical protein